MRSPWGQTVNNGVRDLSSYLSIKEPGATFCTERDVSLSEHKAGRKGMKEHHFPWMGTKEPDQGRDRRGHIGIYRHIH